MRRAPSAATQAGRGAGKAQLGTPSVVADDLSLDELLSKLEGVGEYAIDTEFHRERTYFSRLALVQIAWDSEVVIVDPLEVDPARMRPLMESPALSVLHACDQDLEVLEQSCGAAPRAIFDTQVAAAFLGYTSPSLQTLTESILGIRLQKGDQLSDWTRRPLSPVQLAYAAADVAHLLDLKRDLTARLADTGRTDWAEEEFAVVLAKDRSPVTPELAWWKLSHSRQLRGRSRGVAQEVAAWRERRAQRLNVPPRFVLSDLAVISIAHRPPTSRAELAGTRGIDHRHLNGGVDGELMTAIRAGLSLPTPELRVAPAAPLERANRPIVALAGAYVSQVAADMKLDPAVLATRADLVGLFQHPPAGRLTKGWRSDVLGASLDHLAKGSASLAFDPAGHLILEPREPR